MLLLLLMMMMQMKFFVFSTSSLFFCRATPPTPPTRCPFFFRVSPKFLQPSSKTSFFFLSLSVFISTRKSALMMRDFNKVGVKKERDFLQNDAGITKLLDSLKVYVNQVKNTRDSSNDKKRKLSNGEDSPTLSLKEKLQKKERERREREKRREERREEKSTHTTSNTPNKQTLNKDHTKKGLFWIFFFPPFFSLFFSFWSK